MSFVLSVGGVTMDKTKAATKQLAAEFSTKWDREYLEICGFIQARLSLDLVQSFKLMVWRTHSFKPH